ncbi:hypothetical protein BZA70DRAFT_34446 [Myxozyma melibiosi]|uniref:Histone acetyltransferase n=1 Tax=Myxozyma melibiosi TaxID=54550 RepID=A0ABR1FE08_9ASCO
MSGIDKAAREQSLSSPLSSPPTSMNLGDGLSSSSPLPDRQGRAGSGENEGIQNIQAELVCEICNDRRRSKNYQLCTECNVSRVHVDCLKRTLSSSTTDWTCSSCQPLALREVPRTRSLRSLHPDSTRQTTADVSTNIFENPEAVVSAEQNVVSEDQLSNAEVDDDAIENTLPAPMIDPALLGSDAGFEPAQLNPTTFDTPPGDQASEFADLPQDNSFLGPADYSQLYTQPIEAAPVPNRSLRTRIPTALVTPEVEEIILQSARATRSASRPAETMPATLQPTPASARPSTYPISADTPKRGRGRPRIYPIDLPRSQRQQQPEKRQRTHEPSAERDSASASESTRLTVSLRVRAPSHPPPPPPPPSAPAHESVQPIHLRLTTTHPFRSGKSHGSKLVAFEKTQYSYIAKFNLVQLANHINIYENNLAISGYMSFDQKERNVYLYRKSAASASGSGRRAFMTDNSKIEKPYGGILTPSQADTTRTLPGPLDRMMFGKTMLLTKQKEKIERRHARSASAASKRKEQKTSNRESRERRKRRAEPETHLDEKIVGSSHKIEDLESDDDANYIYNISSSATSSAESELESDEEEAFSDSESEADDHGRLQSISKIRAIRFSNYEIETWYTAPYPEEYNRRSLLFICEYCLKYMSSEYVNWRHQLKCPARHPPGDEIYRSGDVSIFEVDGRKNPMYCQNLCLLAKLFLGSKTLYYDVEPFLFYIMTETDDRGCHFVGYFSKEKLTTSNYNVSCILTLPIYQRKGYGNFLISFSYLLTRTEGKVGTPEKPLSDLGLLSYRNYWKQTMCYQLHEIFESGSDSGTNTISIAKLSERTGMTSDDVVCGLEALNAIVRDPRTGRYAIRVDRALVELAIAKWEAKGYIRLEPDKLIWTPLVIGRAGGINSLSYSTAAWQVGTAAGSSTARSVYVPTPAEPVAEGSAEDQEAAEEEDEQQVDTTLDVNEETTEEAQQEAPDAPEDSAQITSAVSETEAPVQEIEEQPSIPPSRYTIVPPQSLAGVPRSRLWTLDHRVEYAREQRKRRRLETEGVAEELERRQARAAPETPRVQRTLRARQSPQTVVAHESTRATRSAGVVPDTELATTPHRQMRRRL